MAFVKIYISHAAGGFIWQVLTVRSKSNCVSSEWKYWLLRREETVSIRLQFLFQLYGNQGNTSRILEEEEEETVMNTPDPWAIICTAVLGDFYECFSELFSG